MTQHHTIARRAACAALAIGLLCVAASGAGADTPAASKKMIADLKLDAAVTAGWEDEHVVPTAWLAAAKKEGKLRINGSWESREFRDMTKAFSERYPFITFSYSRGSNDTRVRVPLVAFAEGRYTTDIVTGIDSALNQFRSLHALADLKDLPNMKNIPDHMQSVDGDWASVRLRYWCMSYNPKLISKDQMPKTWDELLTTKQLYDGRLALWRGVSSWLLPLWHAKGEDWTKQYIDQLFTVVQPQKRKEGAVALVNLVIAGEFNASLASAEYQVKTRIDKGAPIAFHCPDLLPVTASTVGVLKDNPAISASKLFINWLLSKEGQLAQYVAGGGAPPVHRDLINLGFMPFPDEIAGKQLAFRSPELLDDEIKAMFRALKPYWEGNIESDSE